MPLDSIRRWTRSAGPGEQLAGHAVELAEPTAQSQLNTLNRQKAALEEQIADLEEQLESTFFTPPLQEQIDALQAQLDSLNQEIEELEAEIEAAAEAAEAETAALEDDAANEGDTPGWSAVAQTVERGETAQLAEQPGPPPASANEAAYAPTRWGDGDKDSEESGTLLGSPETTDPIDDGVGSGGSTSPAYPISGTGGGSEAASAEARDVSAEPGSEEASDPIDHSVGSGASAASPSAAYASLDEFDRVVARADAEASAEAPAEGSGSAAKQTWDEMTRAERGAFLAERTPEERRAFFPEMTPDELGALRAARQARIEQQAAEDGAAVSVQLTPDPGPSLGPIGEPFAPAGAATPPVLPRPDVGDPVPMSGTEPTTDPTNTAEAHQLDADDDGLSAFYEM